MEAEENVTQISMKYFLPLFESFITKPTVFVLECSIKRWIITPTKSVCDVHLGFGSESPYM